MRLIKIPLSLGAIGKEGQELAPDKIIKFLDDIWSNEEGKNPTFLIEEISLTKDMRKNHKLIENGFKENAIFIGGDHSITYGLFKGLAKKYKNPGLISFDAHPDLAHHLDYPTHGDWIKYLIEDNVLNKENLILIGIRNPDIKEIAYIKKKKIKVFYPKNIFHNIEEVTKNIMKLSKKFDALYISVDIDVLDPSCAPGTSYLEPGGLQTRELLYMLQKFKKLKNIKAMDITEVNPTIDLRDITSKTAAKIIVEMG